ncbi:MAG: hypothetical protein IPK57_04840 [Chitinophagaceae bacterium]|nr:hypothetical protein [Chitinophagaceae bacterium]
MKKISLLLLIAVSLFGCKSKKDIPDVSGIDVNIPIERFDISFFSIDTNDISNSLKKVQEKHPDFYTDFMQNILGVSGADTSQSTLLVTKEFLRGYLPIYDSLQPQYQKTDWLQKELKKAFQFVKYYYPQYKTGKAILFLGPFDAPGVATTNAGIAIGLQQYAGQNFSVYQSPMGQELFPSYISRRFAPEFITANCMKAVVEELFPDQSGGKPLIEQMIEKGKLWYLLDKFLPSTPDSIKTGYSGRQLNWCIENEGLIWSYLVKNEDLNSLSPAVIQAYIGEAPFTQGFSQELSPGNIGQWIGWQIIKKYVSKNPEMKPEEIMRTEAKKILDEAKYKPK